MNAIEVPMNRSNPAIIDASDANLVLPHKWHVKGNGRTYAQSNILIDGVWKKRLLHRHILNAPTGSIIDHIDGNPLNNSRSNLRFATNAQNSANRCKPNTGRFIGVTATGTKWQAMVCTQGHDFFLGTFDSEEVAAEAYNQAAAVLYGKFASRNPVPAVDGLLTEIISKREKTIRRLLIELSKLKGAL